MLTTDQARGIKACYGIYRAADVSRHYGVHRSTVTRLWAGHQHASVPPAPEPPNVETRPRPSALRDDVITLLDRGMTAQEVADQLGISKSSVYAIGRGVFV